MKETEGSLRAYFILAGAVAVLMALRDVDDVGKLAGVLSAKQKLGFYVPIIAKFLLGPAYIAAGIRLKAALLTGAQWIKTLLVISGAMLFIDGAIVVTVFHADLAHSGITGAVVGLLITIYLHRSVTRLAAEAATRAGIPPSPPTAKVV